MALDTREWLVWLGIKSPQRTTSPVAADVKRLKAKVGDYDALQTLVDNQPDFSGYEGELVNEGFSSDNAAAHRNRVEREFSDWASYSTFVVSNTDSYPEYKRQFGSTPGVTGGGNTGDGEPVAGIRIHESGGVSFDGVDVPAGTVEVFGRRVEFSQQGQEVAEPDISYSNLQVSDTTPEPGQTITISADLQNSGGRPKQVSVPLLENGEVIQTKPVVMAANSTYTMSFQVTRGPIYQALFTVADLSGQIVAWELGAFGI